MPPYVPFAPLTLPPDAAIDLQTHTILSDGQWTAAALLDYANAEGFALVAITDHDRADTVAELQRLAAERGPNSTRILPAVEMSSHLDGDLFDILCFGIPAGPNPLAEIAEDTRRRQAENVQATYDALQRAGFQFPRTEEVLAKRDGVLRQFDDLLALFDAHGYKEGIGKALDAAGYQWITADPAAIVEAAHQAGALALIAHPGRGDGWPRFDADLLDRLRTTVPVDGLEAYYPLHTPEQTEAYLAYAQQHHLLVSAGSDAHGKPNGTKPIKYPAASCRALLERLGIQVG